MVESNAEISVEVGAVSGYRDLLSPALGSRQDAVVLSDDQQRLVGREVGARVDEYVQKLAAAGCGPECLVALRFEPGVESILAILGVLASGAGYLPLDPRHGAVRVASIIQATSPNFVLDPSGLTILDPPAPSQPSRGLDDLGYVISTSGSTGIPKAAVLEQRGLVVHTQAMIDLLDLGPPDVVLQTAPPSFDIAVWQSTTPIVAGAKTHIANDDERLDPRALWRVIIEEKVTVTQLVPSMLRLMLDFAPARESLCLRHVISTGEALDASLANRWLETYPDLELINMYGPAECSDDVCVHTVSAPMDPKAPVPIGRAFAGAHLRVVDQDGLELAHGEIGEIQVCGAVVGRGYRNDPERTADSFDTTIIDGRSVRSYNTGDLGFVGQDGLLRYVGRRDFQVKIRGNRVELGEIERMVCTHGGVRASIVTKFGDDSDRLVAHVERRSSHHPDRSELRRLVAHALPSYMVPSAFVFYDAFPLSPNGKVDRDALLAPSSADRAAVVSRNSRTAESRIERMIAKSWGDLLDLDPVPLDADFFDLGGTSLLAVVSIDELSRELGFEIPTRTLITGGTIERIAAQLDTELGPADSPADGTVGLVQIQDHPTGIPLFLYPGEAVSALGMVDLGRGIASGRPVYVFEPSRPIQGEPGPSMQALASRCRVAIDSVVGDRPVHLAGFCMGGDVSWEIAAQREAAGDPVASVLLLQTERDGVYPSWSAGAGRVQVVTAKLWQRLRFEMETARVLGRPQRRSHIRHLVIGKAIAKLTLPFEQRIHESGLGSRIGLRPSLRLKQHLWALVDRAAYADWTPAQLHSDVVVVRATEQPPLVADDPFLGWGSTKSPTLSARSVTGFHWSFLHHPAVEELAQVVSAELERADALIEVAR